MSKKRRKPRRQPRPQIQGIDFTVASIFADHALRDLQKILGSLSEAARQAQASIRVPGPEIDLPQEILDGDQINIGTIEQLYQDAIDRYQDLRATAKRNDRSRTKRLARECNMFLCVILCNCSPELDAVITGHSSNLLMIIDL